MITPTEELVILLENGRHIKFDHIERKPENIVTVTIYGYEGNSKLSCYLNDKDMKAYKEHLLDEEMIRPALIETIKDFELSGTYIPVKLCGWFEPICNLKKVRGGILYNQEEQDEQ